MTHTEWQDRITEYLDGELSEHAQKTLESHLAGCETCRQAVAEHRRVKEWLVTSAARRPDSDRPSAETWARIEAALPSERRHRGRRRAVASLLAASIVLVALLSRAVSRSGGNEPATRVQLATPAGYEGASRDLEAILARHRAELQPETVAALEQSLSTIDGALADAERALAADPVNEYVLRYLARLRATRLATLRHAVAIAQQ